MTNPQPSDAAQFEAAIYFLRTVRKLPPEKATPLAAELHVFRGTPTEYVRDMWKDNVPETIREYLDWSRLAMDENRAGSYAVFDFGGKTWVADVRNLSD